MSVPDLRPRCCCIAAEMTTDSANNSVTSAAEDTSVTAATRDTVNSTSVDDRVSTEESNQQVTQEVSSSLPQNVTLAAQLSNNASNAQQTENGTTTDSGTMRPTSEADTTSKEQTQSTTNLMSSQQTPASEQTTSQLTTTVSQSTVTSPSPPDVHCCCRCCFPSTPTCTFCDGDSLTDASDCANKEPKIIKPVDRSKPNFEPPAALQGSKHPGRLAYNEEFLKSEKMTETLAALPESEKIELGFRSGDLIVDCLYDGSPCYVERLVLVT